MRYWGKKEPALGVNDAPKIICAKHIQAHPADEKCPYCLDEPIPAYEEDTQPFYDWTGFYP